ncbi:MAG TPA: YdeI/OmpD-associated family protein [Vicinamibacterales bacterium]|nr:YdeI/OmpD-associated family protein [Vicinamibacterales bacterium]
MSAKYFKTAAEFRRWLAANHATENELLVGFYKKASGISGISYQEALDEALCYGWIDGIKKRVDAARYTHRFSPRKADSIWSYVNARRLKALLAAKRVAKPGLDAWQRRDPKKTGVYSFENRPKVFEPSLERTFKADKAAWAFFCAQPPGYRRLMTFYVMSAKQPETRASRLARVIKTSAEGKRIR